LALSIVFLLQIMCYATRAIAFNFALIKDLFGCAQGIYI